MRVINARHPSSEARDRAIAVMGWHRRRIRRARRRIRESGPQTRAPITRASNASSASIRRLVVFVPLATRSQRARAAVAPPARPVAIPGPA
jgi:hypothetical protein